jgi:hypothetical protein
MSRLAIGAATAGVASALLGAAAGALTYRARVNGPFEPTRWVWSRGLALLCDRNGGVDFVKRQRGSRRPIPLDPAAYAGVREGDLVWVRSTALPQFVERVLPSIAAPFALVTGDEDMAIPSGCDVAARILASPLLVRWFAQNFDGTDASGRLSGLPIGLDFHTISNTRKWGHWPTPPREQEAELDVIRARLLPTTRRAPVVYADFQFNRHPKQALGERREAVEAQLRSNPNIEFQRARLKRSELWERRGQVAFVVSPHGNGLDCHRTWEALVLGHVVIVKRSPLDPLYEGLPVVRVDDWSEITRANLDRWLVEHGDVSASAEVAERLTNARWIDHMRRVVREAIAAR